MLKLLRTRLQQGHRTIPYPAEAPALPDRFRGAPTLDATKCIEECHACVHACPTDAIEKDAHGLRLDLGRCLFCSECEQACPTGAIRFTPDYRLATRSRTDLITDGNLLCLADALAATSRRLFGRSLKLRQVSAGGCNACEADVNVLNTVVFDLGRFGIQFVASPRHADGVVITGPVTQNMRLALQKTYDAVPAPKIVIAVGALDRGWSIHGSPGSPEWCRRRGPGRSLHPRLSAPSAHDSRWAVTAAGQTTQRPSPFDAVTVKSMSDDETHGARQRQRSRDLEQFSLGCIPDCFPAHPERSRAGGEVEGARASTSLRYAQPERCEGLDPCK